MAVQYSIPTPKSQFVDPSNGLVSREWFLYLNNIFGSVSSVVGSGVTASSGALTTNALTIADGPSDIKSLTGLTVSTLAIATSTGAIGTPVGLGTGTQVLHGNAAGFPSYAAVSLTADVSGILPQTSGGTGVSSYSAASSVVVNSSGIFSTLAAGTSTQVLHGNATTFPFYSAVALTSDVSGVLPVANGGTNASTALNNSRMVGSSSGAIVEYAALTNGQLFIGSTGGAPVASTLTASTGITITNSAGSIAIAATTAAASGLVLIATTTAASTATIDFATGITSTYNEYLVTITDCVPTTDATDLWVRVSEDGGVTYKAGATDYAHTRMVNADAGGGFFGGATSAAQFLGALGLGNGAGKAFCGELRFWNPAGTSKNKQFKMGASYQSSANTIVVVESAGLFKLDTNAVNAVRLMPSAGFVSSGVFSLYGISK